MAVQLVTGDRHHAGEHTLDRAASAGVGAGQRGLDLARHAVAELLGRGALKGHQAVPAAMVTARRSAPPAARWMTIRQPSIPRNRHSAVTSTRDAKPSSTRSEEHTSEPQALMPIPYSL